MHDMIDIDTARVFLNFMVDYYALLRRHIIEANQFRFNSHGFSTLYTLRNYRNKPITMTEFAGENVEFHPSGCVTFPCLGTKAQQADKLAYDPDRSKRRAIYEDVCQVFQEYTVFVGGSSSFDMAPAPYNKYYALDLFCKENGLAHDNVVFIGDDYGPGGNDESVYQSDFPYLTIDDYRDFPQVVAELLRKETK